MIIQCGRCLAKFRFDDGLMREEGIWVRCGLCQYEFFFKSSAAAVRETAGTAGFSDIEEIQSDREEELSDLSPAGPPVETGETLDAGVESDKTKKRRVPTAVKVFIYVLVTLLVLTGVGILAFPEIGQQIVKELSVYVPWLEKETPQPVSAGIQISDVKQRSVANIFAGNLRVVEGVAVNKSSRPLTRLVMKAALVDDREGRLGEKQAYAGNVLSDDELMTLTEEEMNHRLANPQGSSASNDRIMPGGRIPFMIVIAYEKPGVAKTYVSVASAERLLQ